MSILKVGRTQEVFLSILRQAKSQLPAREVQEMAHDVLDEDAYISDSMARDCLNSLVDNWWVSKAPVKIEGQRGRMLHHYQITPEGRRLFVKLRNLHWRIYGE